MGGILGYIGTKNCVPFLMEGLKKIEQDSYDSSGIAVLEKDKIRCVRAAGKVPALEKETLKISPKGTCGIGHTRWASSGKSAQDRFHPYTDCNQELAVVHNGIVENYIPLREQLEALGHKFQSQTDSEVITHLIEENLKHISAHNKEEQFFNAILRTNAELKGSFAYCVFWTQLPDQLVVVKNQMPLWVGVGEKEFFVSSDPVAFLKRTTKVITFSDGQTAVLTPAKINLYEADGQACPARSSKLSWDAKAILKRGYEHFFLKEVYEQPQGLEDTLRTARADILRILNLKTEDLRNIEQVYMVACGTAYHAALLGKYYLEHFAGLNVSVDLASEFKYRSIPPAKNTLCIAVSQSGQTADTLGAMQRAKELGFKRLAICNVPGSALTRACRSVFYTHCGEESSVASTKAFTSQVLALYTLAIFLGQASGNISQRMFGKLYQELLALPRLMAETLQIEYNVRHLTREIYKAPRILFLGRNIEFPVALEGALKLEEIAYTSAKGLTAGEMKHGPMALVDKEMPVVVLMPKNALFEKMLSSCKECRSYGAFVIAVTTADGQKAASAVSDKQIIIPQASEYLQPVLDTVALQFLAYWIAKRLGRPIDQPRHLTKSITAE